MLIVLIATCVIVRASVAQICNRYCDGRDSSLSPSDRHPVSAAIYGRNIVLHFNDDDDMAWASIDTGNPADQVWLDRSFDGGRTWASGSQLGLTAIPDGARDTSTTMFNVDDWNNLGVGAMRACGKAGDRPEIACTPWARSTWNAGDPRKAAVTGLMQFYNYGTGLFDTTGWWNSANALYAVIKNIDTSGMASYQYAIARTYTLNVNGWYGNFSNDYIDDTGWWTLAWIAAYDLTKDAVYLNTAMAAAEYMHRYWDDVCGGGVWWSEARGYKNAITNSLYLQVNAALHNRLSTDTVYLNRAKAEWDWFLGTGMINSQQLINDGIDLGSCSNNGQREWTYNQGVPLAGLVELYRATGDATYLTKARALADASTTAGSLHTNGVLSEVCDGNNSADEPSFKGIYIRDLGILNDELSDHPYTAYINRQANAAYASNRNEMDGYGPCWPGPLSREDAATQHSAVDLMNLATIG